MKIVSGRFRPSPKGGGGGGGGTFEGFTVNVEDNSCRKLRGGGHVGPSPGSTTDSVSRRLDGNGKQE